MNIKTGLKTLAFALPMAITPLKGSAQTMVKSAEKTVVGDALKLKSTYSVGAGLDPFFDHASAEPKAGLTLSAFAHNMKAEIGADMGLASQNYNLRLAYPFKFKNPNVSVDLGGYFNYQNLSRNKNVAPVYLKSEVASGDVNAYHGMTTTGFYAQANVKPIKKLELNGRVEAGQYALINDGKLAEGEVIPSDYVKDVGQTGALANFVLGAEYNVAKNAYFGADASYSTLHKSPGFNIRTKIKF